VLAADGSVIYANDRAIATFGIKAGELLPFRLRYPELVAAFGRVTGGAGPQQVQFVERVPTERSFAAWFATLDQAGDPKSYLLILDDLTEARATERMRADFVANASHELRTPLASLAGFIETLQGAAKDDPKARDRFLGMMHDQAMRMKRLIEDLLSLSRVEMRAHVRPSERIDLIAPVRHVIDTLTPLARELGVRIDAELPAGKIMVAADRDELVQVFNNLVENACKYGQSGGRVIVRARASESGRGCSVAVIDFGPGIAPEHLPRLTERFYRVDAEESRRHRGTGLGLAIVKHIVSRHRARLQIESEPGHGAQFVVHFPEAELVEPMLPDKAQQNQSVAVS
jgi:two-component system phosphate regulon sensor histidine kinase PhoR